MLLSELPRRVSARVESVRDARADDAVGRRLRELGFVAGESVQVVSTGPFGGDPLVIEVGDTRFALRRAEAARISVRVPTGTGPGRGDTEDASQ